MSLTPEDREALIADGWTPPTMPPSNHELWAGLLWLAKELGEPQTKRMLVAMEAARKK